MPFGDSEQAIIPPRFLDEPNRFPANIGSTSESSSDTIGTVEGVLVSAAFSRSLRSTSKVLILATCQLSNDAATARQITLNIRRGWTGSGTASEYTSVLAPVQKLQAAADDKDVATIVVTDSPSTTTATVYSLSATTDAGSPTSTAKAITVLEFPDVPKFS